MKIYLIESESANQINDEINRIIKDSNNIVYFNYLNTSIEDIIVEASYISFLDEPKFIVVKNADFFSKAKLTDKENEILNNYLKNPNDNSTIIFTTTNKVDLRKNSVKTIKNNYDLIKIKKMNDYELNKYFSSKLKSEGYKISYEDLNYIIKNSLGNFDLITSELNKIKIYEKKKKNLDQNMIRGLVAKNMEDNIFKFINSIIEKNYKLMFKYFYDLKIFKAEPILFINLLSKEYRAMYLIKNIKDSNKEDKICSYLNIQSWQYEKYHKNAYNYKEKELINYIKELYNLDFKIKSGRIEKYLGFELFLLSL